MQLPLVERAGNLRAMKKAPTPIRWPTRWPSLPRRTRGFTILELMITVAVLSILVGVGIPSFQDMMRRNRLATQTNQLLGALAYARSEAVKRGVRVTVCPANDAQDACSDDGRWAQNGMIIFTDNVGAVGEVTMGDEDDPENNDAILQRLPAAADQNINIRNPRILISYMQNGNLELPPGEDSQFILAPENCQDPNGARLVQVIAAGRASARPAACPAADPEPDAG
ncbi:MAG TPA: GspH/FimT family pseudopilin [Steroidobacter sp.]|uniref:GspH/FimT family pseudopilin n=1 Tax=Steroidobacter sp. TaxID=1978227 RepID=UPI002EDA23C9